MKHLLVSMALAAFVSPVFADQMEDFVYRCERDGEERVIAVKYPTGKVLPCEVHYTKYGETEQIWSAQNTRGYCQHKAFEFANKQQDWGWLCFRENPGEEPIAVSLPTSP